MNGKHLNIQDAQVLHVLGMAHSIVVSADDSESSYEYLFLQGSPGLGVPPHVHQREDETFHVLEGSVRFVLEGKEFEAKAGDVVHLPRGTHHGFTIAGDSDAKMSLVIVPGNLSGMFQELASLPAGPPDPEKIAEITGKYAIRFV